MRILNSYIRSNFFTDPSNLLSAFLSILLFAQIPVSFLAFEAGFPNRSSMLLLRGLTLIISSLCIIAFSQIKRKARLGKWVLIILFFWIFYIVRLFFDTTFLGISTTIPTWEILAWAIGVTLIPALAIYSISSRCITKLKPSLIISSGLILLGISAISFSINFNPLENRFLLPDLNPIPAGHAGTSLFLISLCSLLNNKRDGEKSHESYVQFLGVVLGTAITLASSTRSAFGSLVIGFIMISILQTGQINVKSKLLKIWTGLTLITLSCLLLGGSGLIQKIQTIGQGASELNRIVLASVGLQAWLESPVQGIGFKMHKLLGDVFPELSHYYPHNFIVESLLIGGFLLGLILISFILFTLWRSFLLIKLSKEDLWLVCLWMQGLVYVMFSGHLGNVPLFWFSSAAICGRYEAILSQLKGYRE